MTFTPAQLSGYLPAISPNSSAKPVWWVALSGGLDSTVLLHALSALALPVRLNSVHVNHQISPNADTWQAQCAELCEDLGVAFYAHKVSVKNGGKGIEDAAREARYGVFLQQVGAGDVLLTGHHADDQSETLLLRLMRGTGPRGLAAMAASRALGEAQLQRPLLHFTRAELEAYALSHGLRWVEDESNNSDAYDRNYLRNQVMPLLQTRWPDFQQRWQQTASLCADNEQLLEELAAQDLAAAEPRTEKIGASLDLSFLLGLSAARRQNLVRFWLRIQGMTTPEQSHWQQLQQQFFSDVRVDASPDIRWGNVSLRSFRQRFYALPLAQLAAIDISQKWHWDLSAGLFSTSATSVDLGAEGIDLGAAGTLIAESCFAESLQQGQGLLRATTSPLEIRFRQGGERSQPARRAHSQTLKKLLQEYEVEPWLRDRLPLVFCADQLVAVADLWVAAGYSVQPGELGIKLCWLP